MEINYQERMNRLLQASEADVVALVPGANLVYFTGLHFHLSERPIIALISEAGLHFIIPELEIPKLEQRPDLKAQAFTWTDATGFQGAFRDAVIGLDLLGNKLAVDGLTMRVFEWLTFKKMGVSSDDTLDVRRVLLGLRAIKSAEEVAVLRQSIAVTETALERTLNRVDIGMTERDIAAMLKDELGKAGSQGIGLDPIVLIGEKSALPHGNPADRQLSENEILLIDFGGIVGGYPADMTRTFCMGTPTAEMQRVYDTVLQANQAAMMQARPGVTCGDVDKAARDVIEAAGYGDYFIHRTGHGLGLEIHEMPNIAPNDDTLLEPGMVFTIEPGIYIPGVGGVRIEDNVLVTEDGVECLTQFPRSFT